MSRTGIFAALAFLLLFDTAGASTLDDIRSRGTIRIGVRQDAKPFSYYNSVDEPAGYAVDLCRAVSAKLKEALALPDLSIEYVKVTAEDRFEAVKEGRIDLLCGATTITLSRREEVSFSSPIFITGAAVLFRTDGPQSMGELEGRKIGVRSGTTTESALVRAIGRLGLNAEIVRFADHELAYEALVANDIAAYFADRPILIELMEQSPSDKIQLSTAVISLEPYGLALRRGDEDFRLAVDRALAQIYASPELVKIFRAAFGNKAAGALLEAIYIQGALPE